MRGAHDTERLYLHSKNFQPDINPRIHRQRRGGLGVTAGDADIAEPAPNWDAAAFRAYFRRAVASVARGCPHFTGTAFNPCDLGGFSGQSFGRESSESSHVSWRQKVGPSRSY